MKINEKSKNIDLRIISGRGFSGSCYFVGEGRNREMLIVVGDAAENKPINSSLPDSKGASKKYVNENHTGI